MFCPHIGVSRDAGAGRTLRYGQKNSTSCCGSICAAYKTALAGEGKAKPDSAGAVDATCPLVGDKQQEVVLGVVQRNLGRIKASECGIKEATRVVYEAIRKEVLGIIPRDIRVPVAVFGGIHVNTDFGGNDYIEPLCLELLKKEDKSFTNLLPEFKQALAAGN